MSVPKQIQDQAKFVEDTEAAMAQDPATPPPQDPPETPPATPPAPAPTPAPAPVAEDPTWEQRYKSLQGVYTSDTNRLNGQIAGLTQQVQDLAAKLEQATKAPPAPEPAKPAPITPEDQAQFGPELIDLITRQATHIAAQETAGFRAQLAAKDTEIAQLKGQVGEVAKETEDARRVTFLAEARKLCPTLDALNVDPAFMAWLDEIEPMAGVPRQAFLTDAYKRFDHQRMAEIFNRYLAVKTPVATPTPTPNPLDAHVTPPSHKADAPLTETPETRIWTAAEVNQIYTDITRGAYTKSESERLQSEIDAAIVTGRVRS